MSTTRPYLVTIGGQEYMIEATGRPQALSVVVKAHPTPVANCEAASGSTVAAWARAGKPIYDKDNFVPVLPATIVAYVDHMNELIDIPLNIEPGYYNLIIERGTPEAVAEDDAEARAVLVNQETQSEPEIEAAENEGLAPPPRRLGVKFESLAKPEGDGEAE